MVCKWIPINGVVKYLIFLFSESQSSEFGLKTRAQKLHIGAYDAAAGGVSA